MLHISRSTNYFEGNEITSFNGCVQYDSIDPLSIPFGRLIFNKNMEYKYSNRQVYITTRYGSGLIKDIILAALGAGNYNYNLTTDFFVWVDSAGDLKYYDETLDTISDVASQPGLTQEFHKFVMFGTESFGALYGCSETDGVIKVDGATPAYSAIAGSPNLTDMALSALSGRMFGVYKQTIYYTEIQALDATDLTNIEDWAAANFSRPSPDNGRGYQAVIDSGEAMFFFKDTGILCLPNPNEAVANWYFPKTRAKIGTISPKTVCLANYGTQAGIIYLGTDKKLRFIAPTIDRNAGVLPTVINDESHPISLPFQKYLDGIPNAYLGKCTGVYHDNKYILNIVSSTGTDLDFTIIVDCEKLMSANDNEYPQPFWYESANIDFNLFVRRERANELYGFNINGYISKLFDTSKRVDECPARVVSGGSYTIEWKWILGWYRFTKQEAQLIKGYIHWATDGSWNITMMVNAFKFGEAIPQYDAGLTAIVKPSDVGGSYFDISQFDVGRFSSVNNSISQDINIEKKGNYFLYGAWDNTSGRYATFYGISSIFKQIRVSPVSIR